MSNENQHINPKLHVYTLGRFELSQNGVVVKNQAWGREKTLQLFQFLITNRDNGLHKEQIIDRLWPDIDYEAGDRDFKVALHGILKVIEPQRKKREESKFVERQGLIYKLRKEYFFIDIDIFESEIAQANNCLLSDTTKSISHYQNAIALYRGQYLPQWIFQDWTTAERERLQILAMGAFVNCAELLLRDNPSESIRLTQSALKIDNAWEDAYRIQIMAFLQTRNRPQAMRTFKKCEDVLKEEFGIAPLPSTANLLKNL